MEINEKIQELRKRRGLTQEDLAELLYVSRAAISKWESGRGYPNIESLKALANFFSITIDELLSSDELITLAEEDIRHNKNSLRDLIYGLLDICASMLFFLPVFGQHEGEVINVVSLLSLTSVSSYLKYLYCAVVLASVIIGIITLWLRNTDSKILTIITFIITILGTILFIISSQPYAATLMFTFLLIKVVLLVKWQ